MKKIVAITLALLVLAGCSSETYTSGLGMVNSIGSSKSATEEAAGLAQADVTAASVMLDSKGTIVGISFDVVQTKVNFDATGTITTDLATEFKTKKELKEDYNMKPASPIGKEWYEQIDALEKYAMGKAAADFVDTPTKAKDEHHTAVPDVEDLASSCTMDIGDFCTAVFVISLKVTLDLLSSGISKICAKCHAIASPSRSGSVAK